MMMAELRPGRPPASRSILPTLVTAFGVFFMRQYIASAVPDELLEAGCDRRRRDVPDLLVDRRPGRPPGDGRAGDAHVPDRLERLLLADHRAQLAEPHRPGRLPEPGHGLRPAAVDDHGRHAATAPLPVLVVFALLGKQIVGGIMQARSRDEAPIEQRPTRSPTASCGAPPPRPTRSRAPSPRTAARPSIWDTFSPHPGQDRQRRHRRRRLRPLPPVPRGPRPDGRAGPAGLPVLRRPGRGSLPDGPARSTRRASTSTAPRRRAARARHRARGDALPLGPPAGAEDARRLDPRATPRDRFAEYAAVWAGALGDRVPRVTTLNEPWCSAFLGYATGVHAPGRTDAGAGLPRRAPPQPRARSRGHRAARVLPPAATSSVTLNLHQVAPASRLRRRRRAARPSTPCRTGSSSTRCCRPLPRRRPRRHRPPHRLAFVRDGDLARSRRRSTRWASTTTARRRVAARTPTGRATCPGTDRAAPIARRSRGRHDRMGWPIVPAASPSCCCDRSATSGLPMMVTENGWPRPTSSTDGAVHDPDRVAYLRDHLAAVHRRDRRGRRRPRATTCGRCWTTSSGPGATTSASASCTSTTTTQERTPRTPRCGTRRSIRRNGL